MACSRSGALPHGRAEQHLRGPAFAAEEHLDTHNSISSRLAPLPAHAARAIHVFAHFRALSQALEGQPLPVQPAVAQRPHSLPSLQRALKLLPGSLLRCVLGLRIFDCRTRTRMPVFHQMRGLRCPLRPLHTRDSTSPGQQKLGSSAI